MRTILIAPHMDDEVVGAHTQITSLDKVVFMTDSSCQWRRVTMPGEESIRSRKESARQVAQKYGFEVVFLDFSSEFLHRADPEYKAEVFRRITAEIEPDDIVYVPSLFDQNLEHNLYGAYAIVACLVKSCRIVMYTGSYPIPGDLVQPIRCPYTEEKWIDLQLYPGEARDLKEVGYPFMGHEQFLPLGSR